MEKLTDPMIDILSGLSESVSFVEAQFNDVQQRLNIVRRRRQAYIEQCAKELNVDLDTNVLDFQSASFIEVGNQK